MSHVVSYVAPKVGHGKIAMNKDIELGKRIAELRMRRGFSQKEAAERVGIKYPTYQKYEYGNHPSRKKLDQLHAFYMCNKTWLITGEGEPYPAAAGNYPEPEPVKPLVLLNEPVSGYGPPAGDRPDIKISEDMALAAKVLESGTPYATALHLNIRAFARSIQAEERITQVEQNQLAFKREMQSRMEELEKTIKRLEVENKALKGCAGDSPLFSLSPANCAPTGTGEPEK